MSPASFVGKTMYLKYIIILMFPLSVAELKQRHKNPTPHEIIKYAANSVNIPVKLLNAICYTESKNNPNAIHYHDGKSTSYGMCQIKRIAAAQVGFKGNPIDLQQPFVNTYWAARYLRYQLVRYHWNVRKAVNAFNHGHWIPEIDDYEKRVLAKL